MKKLTKNAWLALMLMLVLCVSQTHAQQKFDKNGYAIEPDEEETLANNNQNTPKNVNQSYSQPVAIQNTNYQTSGSTSRTSYSTSSTGCCSHSTTTIVNVGIKITAGGSNNTFMQSAPRTPNIVRVVNYDYPQNYYYPNPVMYNGPQYCNNNQPQRRPRQHVTYQPDQQVAIQPQPVQTHHGTFQNGVHGGQFNNGVHGGSFGNGSSGGTFNPPVTTGGGGGNGGVHHGKF